MKTVNVLELFIAAFIVAVVSDPLLKRVKFGFWRRYDGMTGIPDRSDGHSFLFQEFTKSFVREFFSLLEDNFKKTDILITERIRSLHTGIGGDNFLQICGQFRPMCHSIQSQVFAPRLLYIFKSLYIILSNQEMRSEIICHTYSSTSLPLFNLFI